MKTLPELGSEYQRLRKAARLTQEETAARTGMVQETLSRFERGRANDFSVSKLLRLAAALGYDVVLTPAKPRRPTLEDVLAERKNEEVADPRPSATAVSHKL
jgi:HTH-type transcriptional regulator / antitoxin HipB